MTIDRWFTRCAVCLVVTAINERPAHNAICGVCTGPIENMGRVERDRLVQEHLTCKCDDRCTSARGPHCNCKCGGENHGAGLIGGYHLVKTDKGPVPTVTPTAGRAQAEINARDFHAATSALRVELAALLDRKAGGEYLHAATFNRLRELQRANATAWKSRDHRSRMKGLRAVIGHGEIPTPATSTPARPITPIGPLAQSALF